MPALNTVDPASIRTHLRLWLSDHPGWHTSRQVADGVGTTDPAARTALIRELNRLTRSRSVVSYRPSTLPKRGPGTMYARVGTAPPSGEPTT